MERYEHKEVQVRQIKSAAIAATHLHKHVRVCVCVCVCVHTSNNGEF